MTGASRYTASRRWDGSYALHCTQPAASRTVATIAPVLDRAGQVLGWRLRPFFVTQGTRSRVWATVADAIAATKLMTPGRARIAVQTADAAASAPQHSGGRDP